MKTVWCVFSVENNYDQPDNNLEAVFLSKPDYEELVCIFNSEIAEILSHTHIRYNECDYRLEEIIIGERLK